MNGSQLHRQPNINYKGQYNPRQMVETQSKGRKKETGYTSTAQFPEPPHIVILVTPPEIVYRLVTVWNCILLSSTWPP